MQHAAALRSILAADLLRWRALALVQSLELPDCWIGAGFVRNAVWDHLHGRAPTPPSGDTDVLWFDPTRLDPAHDSALESVLRRLDPALNWSVKNQARMHVRNDDPPYTSSTDAIRHWPETATAIAVCRAGRTGCDIAAPFGLDDLFGLVIRPTPRFRGSKHTAYLERLQTKQWTATWPNLRPEAAADASPTR